MKNEVSVSVGTGQCGDFRMDLPCVLATFLLLWESTMTKPTYWGFIWDFPTQEEQESLTMTVGSGVAGGQLWQCSGSWERTSWTLNRRQKETLGMTRVFWNLKGVIINKHWYKAILCIKPFLLHIQNCLALLETWWFNYEKKIFLIFPYHYSTAFKYQISMFWDYSVSECLKHNNLLF